MTCVNKSLPLIFFSANNSLLSGVIVISFPLLDKINKYNLLSFLFTEDDNCKISVWLTNFILLILFWWIKCVFSSKVFLSGLIYNFPGLLHVIVKKSKLLFCKNTFSNCLLYSFDDGKRLVLSISIVFL